MCMLKKGLNFAVTPRKLPVVEVITATESACRGLDPGDANELRAKVVGILDREHNVKDQNVTKQEWASIDSLKKDESIMVLPADKGRTTVVMNRKDYDRKCQDLIADNKTYVKLKTDPTRKFKAELVAVLKDLKDRKVITPALHKTLYPTVDQPPRF